MLARPALLLTALLLPVAATAGDHRSAMVRYGDLNLASDAGRASLETRIRAAVRSVCAAGDSRNLRELAASAACRDKAEAKAMASMQIAVDRAASRDQLAMLSVR